MCNKLVSVYFPRYETRVIATPSGKTKTEQFQIGFDCVDVRCGHALTDSEKANGYRSVDPYGRAIRCEAHTYL